jgi:putative ATP-dependent endonuclease of the OLD family
VPCEHPPRACYSKEKDLLDGRPIWHREHCSEALPEAVSEQWFVLSIAPRPAYPGCGWHMYLKTLKLRNFRTFDDTEILLRPDLTVFVGENNGGKSNGIDAIRLLTKPLGGRRDLYCETTDIRIGSAQREFELVGRFEGLSPPQQGRLISAATDNLLTGCVFGLRYDERGGRYPTRPVLWGGAQQGTPEPGCHDMIRHLYLPPLRDAKRELASGHPARIYALLNHFLEGSDPEELARTLRRSGGSEILDRIAGAVEGGLSALTAGVRRQAAAIGFADDERLFDIARDLRFKLADYGVEPEDLRYSGHGYANLLYVATIAVELAKVNDAELTLFLVEEPEAHLHPQLQAAVLGFLEEQAAKSRRPSTDSEGPAGHLQIVVATHSSNLSAWVESTKLVFFRSHVAPALAPAATALTEGEGDVTEAAPLRRRVTRCVPLGALDLTAAERRKVERYLDVTKSALLFGGRVLLVEGMAETLLLPTIARRFVLKDDIHKLRLFRSAVFVAIDGVDFMPYTKLLLTAYEQARIADRLVVVTDGDAHRVQTEAPPPGARRKAALEAVAEGLGASHLMTVIVNDFSLEAELIRAGNGELLKQVYLELHPRSAPAWEAAVAQRGMSQAVAVQALFQETRKGDFAQLLADAIDQGATFEVPSYLELAINTLVS